MNEKIKVFIKQNLGYLVVAFVSAIYIASALLMIDETGKSVQEIIADTTIVFLLGLSINRVFDLQGIMNGDRDERTVATLTLHGETVVKISPYLNSLDDWCGVKNDENLKMQRTRILATEGMRYDDFFEKDGSTKGYPIDEAKLKNKLTRKTEKARMRCYRKALRVKLTPLSASLLTSEGGKSHDPYNFGRTKSQYEKQNSVIDVGSRVFTALGFGYYGVKLIQNFSYATLIWNALQVGIFLLMGVITMNRSFMFITDEYRGRIVKKINHLEMFYNYTQTFHKDEGQQAETSEAESKEQISETTAETDTAQAAYTAEGENDNGNQEQ